jgi:hypothetical protein
MRKEETNEVPNNTVPAESTFTTSLMSSANAQSKVLDTSEQNSKSSIKREKQN